MAQGRNIKPLQPAHPTEVSSLASTSSRPVTYSTFSQNCGPSKQFIAEEREDEGSVLDPSHPGFDAYKWASSMVETGRKKGLKQRKISILFKNLNVYGSDEASTFQKTVTFLRRKPANIWRSIICPRVEKTIFRQFEGVLRNGEMLLVLGRPGSGCSTLLKTISGNLHGLVVDQNSELEYNGIELKIMVKEFKGEIVYNQEVDRHFPNLTVGQTLEFASYVRTPRLRVKEISRKENARYLTRVVMAIFGLSHTYNTKVGNDYVRGVSGGERKRVSIAEMTLAGSPLACWDNSTRGLDAATALEFVKALRMSADLLGPCHLVAIYQASQAIYDLFDRTVVLYDGREIYYGPAKSAKAYFEHMGWYCPSRQSTGDFLTGVTNKRERRARPGYEHRVPQTADEFKSYWQSSPEYASLQEEIKDYKASYPDSSRSVTEFRELRKDVQSKYLPRGSPYTISIFTQVKACTRRAYQRLWNDRTSTITMIISKIVMAVVIGSIYYRTPANTDGFFAKGSVLFFSILFNALNAIVEINALYNQRPIVEKHASYAFYHPFAEALGSLISDLPIKILSVTLFCIVLYFLANLRREPSHFFIFLMFNLIAAVTMSCVARTIGAATKTVSKALAIAGVMVLGVVIYTGFTIPQPYMRPWFAWISWINPVAYAFEGLLINELHGRDFPCSTSSLIPPYLNIIGDAFICSIRGALPGEMAVAGEAYLEASYQYSYSHLWRNFGILWGFLVFFLIAYLIATELNSSTSSTSEVLVFRYGSASKQVSSMENATDESDAENLIAGTPATGKSDRNEDLEIRPILPQKHVFTWRNVTYDIIINDQPRRLLDHVSGYVKPGTLTALMGVSGAGKTTLLDTLAQRISVGVITGDMFINGRRTDSSFQRKIGYVQQQDLHLETSTVREALQFSAVLRQPGNITQADKYQHVESVIDLLNMHEFADAVVGVPGEGLNVEQRKLLSIGVELSAKPQVLIFLDEPTSGLDSQSAWAIVSLMRKLANHGQAILATIHQPSSMLFLEFDRLLFLAQGGRTVYFGNIGPNASELLSYFESQGARKCGTTENPAEYILEIIGARVNGQRRQDWATIWRESEPYKRVNEDLDRIHQETSERQTSNGDADADRFEFAMPFLYQLYQISLRVFQQYWRSPTYIYGKFFLGVASGVFIGFSFVQIEESVQGLQNAIFSNFLVLSIFSALVQQIMPRFITQRSLYEIRERPSKVYSWAAFIFANILVEIPYQVLLGTMVFGTYFYPVFGVQPLERQVLVLLFLIEFFLFASTFAHMLIAGLPDAGTAGQLATVLFSLSLVFNGVMQPPEALPRFWIFMWRVSPLTYFVQGITGTAMAGRRIQCSSDELSIFDPPSNQTCGTYLAPFLTSAPGRLNNPTSTANCSYCALRSTDQFLAVSGIDYSTRWRNFGLLWAYITFNIFATIIFYYTFRIKKWSILNLKYLPAWLKACLRSAGYAFQSILIGNPKEDKKGTEAQNDRLF